MNLILIKMFATALALSQVTTRPQTLSTHFDPVTDQPAVVQLLRDGCAHMRKAFDIEELNLDALVDTAMEDPKSVASEIRAFRGISFDDLFAAYKQYCGNEPFASSRFDLKAVIEFYNKVAADLPDHSKLKNFKLPGTSIVLDNRGDRFAELFESDERRVWVPIDAIPEFVQQAFIAAEDKRFLQHHGVDERGLIRAFIANLAEPGRPQGGSTITQQVAKNLLVGDDVSYERKIREMIVASRIDQSLTKAEILEVYLNSIYLGRGSWGIDMAARSYFKKNAAELTLTEGAMLAAMAKGPAYFSPDRYPERARERYAYVLKRMHEDKIEGAEALQPGVTAMPRIVPYERPRRDIGFHFIDHLMQEARTLVGMQSLTVESYTVRSTINSKLQRATEAALQEGLARYEASAGRAKYRGPELSLSDGIMRVTAEQSSRALRRGRLHKPAWQVALQAARLPLYDVHWPPAVVLERDSRRPLRIGLRDGRTMPLILPPGVDPAAFKINDVIYVQLAAGNSRADLRIRPQVQGSALVLENKTGRILAMVGGFSYPLSQLNRTEQTQRQPGSAIKPLVYLAALHRGLRPESLVHDAPITLPPIPGVTTRSWTPRNYNGSSSGTITLRQALEHSKNLATTHLLEGAIDKNPSRSLERICQLAVEAKIYPDCIRNYPFVLGAQAVHAINLAAFYAAIANGGSRVSPYAIESIEQREHPVYHHHAPEPYALADGDRASFYNLRSMLEGVVSRGTAASMSHLSNFVAGKTGTTDGANDAWFIGFTSEVTVAVWVGYDNSRGRQTLGEGKTGSRVAVPIAEPIIQATWTANSPKTRLPQPSAETARQLGGPREAGGGWSRSRRGHREHLQADEHQRPGSDRRAVIGRRQPAAPAYLGGARAEADNRLMEQARARRGLPQWPGRSLQRGYPTFN
jgi:membrane carboxypeptidase/penicillin-binding protein